MEALLKAAGLDVAILSCCVVNQSSLAIDARSPVKLVERMERLVGTWQLRSDIEAAGADLHAATAAEGAARARADELRAVRLEMRPEVARLLACDAQHRALHATNVSAQGVLAQRNEQLADVLRAHVRALHVFCWVVSACTARAMFGGAAQHAAAQTTSTGCRSLCWRTQRRAPWGVLPLPRQCAQRRLHMHRAPLEH